jgi:ribosomal protein S18 acetylase RimI-like enzyme
VARSGPRVVGHLQVTGTGQPGQAEVKNMAVREEVQGQGIGRRLMQAALALLAAEGVTRVRVATAAADTGNLRFYQRQGFRMFSIERDAFTESSGYPPGSQASGIALRDRVWLDIPLGSELTGTAAAPDYPAQRDAAIDEGLLISELSAGDRHI